MIGNARVSILKNAMTVMRTIRHQQPIACSVVVNFKNRSLEDKLTYLEDLHAYTQLMSGFYADRHMLDLQLLKVLPQESMVA